MKHIKLYESFSDGSQKIFIVDGWETGNKQTKSAFLKTVGSEYRIIDLEFAKPEDIDIPGLSLGVPTILIGYENASPQVKQMIKDGIGEAIVHVDLEFAEPTDFGNMPNLYR
jgi:hypothetical protein